MPIQLGYLELPSSSRDPKQEKEREQREYKERWNVARRQLNCMRTYMYYVNKFFAAQLRRQGHRFTEAALIDYVNSETHALGLGQEIGKTVVSGARKYVFHPYPTLSVAMDKARADRRGLPVSWVFQRLWELGASPVFVQVWDAPKTSKAVGAESESERQEKRDEHFWKADYVWVKAYYEDPCNPSSPPDKRGEAYVHELVIHAWRHVKFGTIDPSYRYQDEKKAAEARKARLYYLYGHHRGGKAHVLDDQELRHSLSDVEADLLWYYLEFIENGRAVHREQLNRETRVPQHAKGEFQRLIRAAAGDSLMCDKVCHLPGAYKVPRPQGR